ncbi:MAG TPA: glycoside hydrolase family 3 C-terminal domain-containing protein [Pseudonocardiaceae bacterium]|nr:glycoside hydrolase family 3 C-terminal domain-containing protein [Pseudonocardiaceae bacterium]
MDHDPGTDLSVLVAKLGLEQKVRLLAGASPWRTYDEPAIGLRAMVMSDGPVGVRGEHWDERDTSLALPSPTALAATFDEDLVRRLGGVLAAEARRKHVDILLAPMLNLHRSPVAGRHFECFSEDPLLTARIGAAYITGVQAGGVAATAKHYVANDSETERLTLGVRVDDATLHEVYLAPFEAAVDAGVWVVMSAYNAIGGVTMTEHPLLREPLKGGWAFDGVVVSDWGAVRSVIPSARAAQDLAMPGPGPWGDELLAAVRSGDVTESAIDEKVLRLLRLAERVGALNGSTRARSDVDGQSRALLRRTVAAGSVLVRNENNLLPLSTSDKSIAVLGPNAAATRILGGGSAGLFPAAVVSPLAGICSAVDGRAEVRYAAGVYITDTPAPLHTGNARDPRTGEPGVLLRLLDNAGTEIHAEHRMTGRILEPAAGEMAGVAAVEVRAVLRPDVTGRWRLAVTGIGRLTLTADGDTVFDDTIAEDTGDPAVVNVAPPSRPLGLDLVAGRDVELVLRRQLSPDTGWVVALAAEPPRRESADELAAAVALARDSDVAIVVVGTTEEFESEGFDRTTLALPGDQDALVRAVAAVNPRTVVIVNAGGPVLLPWPEVPAVLLSWFPGQEAGDGLADVLFGRCEPGGRLPTTWPAAIEDVPVLSTTPVLGVLDYAEGPNIGYRAWIGADAEPAYWFGHGLGYTTWTHERVVVPASVEAGRPFTVSVRVRNTGRRAGREVVQVYLTRPGSAVTRPARWLAGFAAAVAAPGETVEVDVEVAPRAVQHWSTADGAWRTEPGEFEVYVGRSAGDLTLRATTTVTGDDGSLASSLTPIPAPPT